MSFHFWSCTSTPRMTSLVVVRRWSFVRSQLWASVGTAFIGSSYVESRSIGHVGRYWVEDCGIQHLDRCLDQLRMMISWVSFLSRLLRSYSIRVEFHSWMEINGSVGRKVEELGPFDLCLYPRSLFCPICKEGDLLKSFVFW